MTDEVSKAPLAYSEELNITSLASCLELRVFIIVNRKLFEGCQRPLGHSAREGLHPGIADLIVPERRLSSWQEAKAPAGSFSSIQG